MKNTNNIKFSKNKKLNTVLQAIYDDLTEELGSDEVKRYKNKFKNEIDFNIAQYGNLLCYYNDIRQFYKDAGYKSLDKLSDGKIWNIYKRQVGYVARFYF